MPTPNLPHGFDFLDPDRNVKKLPVDELAELRKLAPIWMSFMTESWMMGKDVSPSVQARVKKCSYSYNFSANLRKQLPGNDTLLPVNFDRDFATVMEVYRKSQSAPAAPK